MRTRTPILIGIASAYTAAALAGCGKPNPGPSITASANFYNGATTVIKPTADVENRESTRPHALTQPSGSWYFAPDQMTMTLVGACFVPSGSSQCGISQFTNPCIVTYDRSNPSLTPLANCSFTAAAGTYVGIQLEWNTTYSVLIDDSLNSIYTNASSSTLLSSTGPAATVSLTDPNSNGSTNDSVTFFPSARTFSASSTPAISVLFDPAHWLVQYNAGQFGANLATNGNPPIYATLGNAGQAMIYNDAASTNQAASGTPATGNILLSSGSLNEIKILLSGPDEPVSLSGPNNLCGTHSFSAWPSSPQSGCAAQNGGCFGEGGFLGADTTSDLLSWAFPSDSWLYQSYGAVAELQFPAAPTVGTSYVLSYVCNPSPGAPAPTAGASTYTTAPSTLSTYGTVQTMNLTLVAD